MCTFSSSFSLDRHGLVVRLLMSIRLHRGCLAAAVSCRCSPWPCLHQAWLSPAVLLTSRTSRISHVFCNQHTQCEVRVGGLERVTGTLVPSS